MSNLLKNISLMARKAARAAKQSGAKPEQYHDSFFIQKVLSVDSKPETTRVGTEYLHVSSLIGMCLRRHLIAYSTKVERSKSVNSAMRVVWALGRAAESHIRNQFIEAMDYRDILGVWKCKCGHLKVSGLYDDTLKCPKCEKKASSYSEYSLFDHENRIVGSPDMVYIRPDNRKAMVVECKSINKNDFLKLSNPIWDHVHQAVSYNELLKINGVEVDDSVTIVYVCKDYNFGGPYKEFRVKRDDQLNSDVAFMWGQAKEYARQLDIIKAGKKPSYPNRLSTCTTQEDSIPKSCDCCGMCFALPNG